MLHGRIAHAQSSGQDSSGKYLTAKFGIREAVKRAAIADFGNREGCQRLPVHGKQESQNCCRDLSTSLSAMSDQ